MTGWPYPGDAPIVAARRVAWAYRQRLAQVAPDDCAQLDTVMQELGQHWAIPRPVPPNPDAWISAAAAATLAGTTLASIRSLRRAGRLTGRRKSERQWEYQVREILGLADQRRTRHTQTRETSPAP